MNREKRQKQYVDTITKCKHLPGLNFTPSVKYRFDEFPDVSLPVCTTKKPIVYSEDVIGTILRTSASFKTLALNLASAKHFGGGAETGALAQEEELFRKTDYGCHPGKELYPLNQNEYVFTPDVTVIKGSDYRDLGMTEFRTVDMIAMPGVRLPQKCTTLKEEDMRLMTKKIETVFLFAIHHGYQVLVLGALGCGVFNNPPEVIAGIFQQCIIKYGEAFEQILFSVYSLPGNDNFDIFNRVLSS